ncbi:hypothetical protein NEIMUCOT_05977 [Neisseria mucosa ATCC 25996]|uniref:Uncharacterized protein n=1 Tax=Neisseria mucosa (strain ATCC 25996 / DSM 4631 / NCTC 10774 / M26) TaxID=546266 RepID=D2ZZA2_NEIM2|nr:hypothetical protein NEIMUCOT_05977 [Neisseria mucosa ATCC 25996]
MQKLWKSAIILPHSFRGQSVSRKQHLEDLSRQAVGFLSKCLN